METTENVIFSGCGWMLPYGTVGFATTKNVSSKKDNFNEIKINLI